MMNRTRLPLWLLLSAALSACSLPPPRQTSPAPSTRPDVEQLLAAAESATPLRAAQLQLEAARLRLAQGDEPAALAILERIDTRRLPPAQAFEVITLLSQQALEQQDAERALSALDPSRLPPSLGADQQAELNQLRADAYVLQGTPLLAVRELIAAAQLSPEPEQQQPLHNRIWQLLQSVTPAELDTATHSGLNNYYEQGWFELAQAGRQSQSLLGAGDSLQQWRLLWEAHPAFNLPPEAVAPSQQPITAISANRVGLLLPLSGNLADPARAISEGFYAALFEQGRQGFTPQVITLDSTAVNDPASLFALAQQQQLDLIIGPLERDYVQRLAALPTLPVPVLALNQADGSGELPFQLDLSSDHEAALVAQRAWLDGHRNVALITPDTPWGQRLQSQLASDFERLGGRVSARLDYQINAELSSQISNLLLTDNSRARARQVRQVVGRRLETQEQPRTDVDALLLVALPQEARQIKPMLAYHFAGDIPVYATAHLYEGQPDAVRDVDLNGIRFVDLPWILLPPSPVQQALLAGQAPMDSRFNRLYALGVDAFRVHPHLTELASNPSAYVEGETGRLRLSPQRRLTRELPWAEFRDGVPVVLPDSGQRLPDYPEEALNRESALEPPFDGRRDKAADPEQDFDYDLESGLGIDPAAEDDPTLIPNRIR